MLSNQCVPEALIRWLEQRLKLYRELQPVFSGWQCLWFAKPVVQFYRKLRPKSQHVIQEESGSRVVYIQASITVKRQSTKYSSVKINWITFPSSFSNLHVTLRQPNSTQTYNYKIQVELLGFWNIETYSILQSTASITLLYLPPFMTITPGGEVTFFRPQAVW